MPRIEQITIHPREIPPKRKSEFKPAKVFSRPFDPPLRVGAFPIPQPSAIEKINKLTQERYPEQLRKQNKESGPRRPTAKKDASPASRLGVSSEHERSSSAGSNNSLASTHAFKQFMQSSQSRPTSSFDVSA